VNGFVSTGTTARNKGEKVHGLMVNSEERKTEENLKKYKKNVFTATKLEASDAITILTKVDSIKFFAFWGAMVLLPLVIHPCAHSLKRVALQPYTGCDPIYLHMLHGGDN
jgi:hypothetical protein